MGEQIAKTFKDELEENRSFFQSLLNEQKESLIEELRNSSNTETERKIQLLTGENERLIRELNECRKNEENMQANLKKLEEEKGEYKKKNEELEKNLDEIEKKKEDLEKLKPRYDQLNERYKLLDDAYTKYLNLSRDTKERLRNIFQKETVESFLSAGALWENIEELWRFLRTSTIEGDCLDINQLRECVKYLFHVYNQKSIQPAYALIQPNVGESFDSDKQSILGEKTDGIVGRVLLEGIENRKTGKVIFKALITV